MRGVQKSRRLHIGAPLTPPLRGDPLRKGEGLLSIQRSRVNVT